MNLPQVPDERPTGSDSFEQQPDAAMTVSAEHVNVGTEWTVSGRVRLRRQIETRTETIQVTLRREVLIVDTDDAVEAGAGVLVGGATDNLTVEAPGASPEPIVLVLSEEVPQVTVQVQPYERVRAEVVRSTRDQSVTAAARREQVVLEDVTVGTAQPSAMADQQN